MNREQYLIWRNSNSPEPLYEYYKENHKGGLFLNHDDFFRFFQMWPEGLNIYAMLIAMYDIKFEVMCIQNVKTGQVIKYL